MAVGDTYIVEILAVGHHLHVVLSNETEEEKVLIAHITTRRKYRDATCVLRPGDHPFITHESVVLYEQSRLVDIDWLERNNRSAEPFSDEVIKRVLDGAVQSPDIKSDFPKLLRDQGLIE